MEGGSSECRGVRTGASLGCPVRKWNAGVRRVALVKRISGYCQGDVGPS